MPLVDELVLGAASAASTVINGTFYVVGQAGIPYDFFLRYEDARDCRFCDFQFTQFLQNLQDDCHFVPGESGNPAPLVEMATGTCSNITRTFASQTACSIGELATSTCSVLSNATMTCMNGLFKFGDWAAKCAVLPASPPPPPPFAGPSNFDEGSGCAGISCHPVLFVGGVIVTGAAFFGTTYYLYRALTKPADSAPTADSADSAEGRPLLSRGDDLEAAMAERGESPSSELAGSGLGSEHAGADTELQAIPVAERLSTPQARAPISAGERALPVIEAPNDAQPGLSLLGQPIAASASFSA